MKNNGGKKPQQALPHCDKTILEQLVILLYITS